MGVRETGGFLDAARLADWTRRFVRHASPQTDLFEAEPAVQSFIGECVAPLLDEVGLAHRRDAMGNLLVELGGGGQRHLLLMAYAMTHPAASMDRPYEGDVVESADGKLVRGRGVAEQKGALAAVLGAVAQAAHEGGLAGRLTLAVSTAGETGRHDAAESIVRALEREPTAAVIVIGTSGRVSLANKGRLDVRVCVHGRAAHSSTPWAGVNALEGIRRVMNQLTDAKFRFGLHPHLGQATLTPTFVESEPRATHTVQSLATLTLDRRLLPGQEPDEALRELRSAIRLEEPWRVCVDPGPFMQPCEVSADGDLVRAIEEGSAAAGAPAAGRFHSHGALDAGFFAARGIEATMWGPGDMDQWHTDEEAIRVDDVVAGARGYYGLIRHYLAS